MPDVAIESMSEQMQEDLQCMLESQIGEIEYIDEVISMACQIVVDRVREYKAGKKPGPNGGEPIV